eukprot:SAG22_NODE_1905_length_3335_cov_2.377627_2_plen_80_part_00
MCQKGFLSGLLNTQDLDYSCNIVYIYNNFQSMRTNLAPLWKFNSVSRESARASTERDAIQSLVHYHTHFFKTHKRRDDV